MKRYGSVFLVGDSHATPIGRLLRDRLGADVVLADSVNGRRTADLRADPRLPSAELTIVILGGNDRASGGYPAELYRLLNLFSGGEVVWVGPFVATAPDAKARHDEVRAIQRSVLPSTRAQWIDGYALSRVRDLRSDGVHFTESGYERITNELLKRLDPGITGILLGGILGALAWMVGR